MKNRKQGFVFALCTVAISLTAQVHPTWVGTWAAAPMGSLVNPGQPSPVNSTYRNVVRISIGGNTLRVKLTNELGANPLKIGSAHVALSAGNGAIDAVTDHSLTFDGSNVVTIPAGAFVLSDPVAMPVKALTSLALSVYLPEQYIGTTTCHDDAQSTNFVTPGDTTSSIQLSSAREIASWCFVKGVDVEARPNAAAIVTFGDSITDGAKSTPDENRRWPDVLAERLQADPDTAHLTVLNEGIGGNRLLHDIAGPNALARFDRDVIAQAGVKYLLILEGINDIGYLVHSTRPEAPVNAQDIIFALRQLAVRAHEHGIRVYGCTLTPYGGAGYSSAEGEQMRQAVNNWIRTSGTYDAVIDFDKATRDPTSPVRFRPNFDSGDHLHPSDAGYTAMGSTIELSLFTETSADNK